MRFQKCHKEAGAALVVLPSPPASAVVSGAAPGDARVPAWWLRGPEAGGWRGVRAEGARLVLSSSQSCQAGLRETPQSGAKLSGVTETQGAGRGGKGYLLGRAFPG